MVIKGSGGEGKSQIGVVLSRLFGCNMKDGSIGKISENRFARADLEHTLLCVDDDMRMEALRQTNYVKSIVTAQGQMDLERKGKQSYQGWMYARLLAFSNGDLQALYDRSDGFYRRQLILTTKDKPLSRVDDPDIAEKMAAEVEDILLWAFEGLQRLVKNGFQFTESDRTKRNREGFSKVGMKTVLIGAVCNIILDPVFIFAFDMGVQGAALATVISQAISAVWVILFLTGKQTKLKIKTKYFKPKASVLLPVCALGVSPFIMNATESAINIAFNASLSRYGGDVAVGAMTILSSIMQLQFMPVQGIAQGAQPIMSFNYGAKKMDRVKKAYRLLMICSFTYTMIFCLAVEIAPGFFVHNELFFSGDGNRIHL